MAPIVRALAHDDVLSPVVCVTGQHREMLDQVNALFGIAPDYDLDVIRPRQSLTHITTAVLQGAAEVIAKVAPRAVVVQGDTTSTYAAAMAAFYAQVPVVHVEAGLRTQDRYSPFPEEINRRLTTQLAALHLAPTTTSLDNLLREGIDRSSVVVTGNTVIDALHLALASDHQAPAADVTALLATERRIVLVTAHRRESWGAPLREIAQAVRQISEDHPDVLVVFPMHRNPVVREAVVPVLEGRQNVVLLDPLDYYDFTRLMSRAHVVLSDSGGVQEEAPALGIPVLVLRDNTERPEAVQAGTAALVGSSRTRIVESVRHLLTDAGHYARMSTAVNPYGDGQAAPRTVQALRHLLLGEARPSEFSVRPAVAAAA